jgi:hypothetical protein
VRGRLVRPLGGVELQEWLCSLCRRTALHNASLNGHTETAMALAKAGADVHCKDNDGYGSRGCILVSLGRHGAGADGPSNRVCSRRSGWFGCAGGRRCTGRRRTATRRRRWRWWRRAWTFTPRTTTGTVQRSGCILASSCRWFAAVHGRPVFRPRLELQEWLLWLCSRTALHDASLHGQTETAMALIKVGADVHCKDNDGYGSSGYLGELREGLCATGK